VRGGEKRNLKRVYEKGSQMRGDRIHQRDSGRGEEVKNGMREKKEMNMI